MATGILQCLSCGTLFPAVYGKCTCCPNETPTIRPTPLPSTQERLAVEWEKMKHLIPDSELKSFICLAIMQAMERWNGGEPPKPKTLTVTVDTPVDPKDCYHEFQYYINKGTRCVKCGDTLVADPCDFEPYPSGPISPYAGGNIG